MVDWCRQENIDFSRSRPGKKNDNMYVEERNGHVVRRQVGYIRLDTEKAVAALRNGIRTVVLPSANASDLELLPAEGRGILSATLSSPREPCWVSWLRQSPKYKNSCLSGDMRSKI